MANNTTEQINPEEYEFLGATFSAQQEAKCARCDSPIKYFYAVKHKPTNKNLVVGSECVKILTGKTVAQATREIKQEQARQATIDQERTRMQEIDSFKRAHEAEFNHFFAIVNYCKTNNIDHEFTMSLSRYYDKFDTLTPKQLAAQMNITTEQLDNVKKTANMKQEIRNMLADLMLCNLGSYDREFFKSLQDQFNRKDYLSERQTECLRKMHTKYRNQIISRARTEADEALSQLKEATKAFLDSVSRTQKPRPNHDSPNGRPDGLRPEFWQYWNFIKEMSWHTQRYKNAVNQIRSARDRNVKPYPITIPDQLHRYIIAKMDESAENIDALNAALGSTWRGKTPNQARNYNPEQKAEMLKINAGPVKCATCSERQTITLEDLQTDKLIQNIAIIPSKITKRMKAFYICPLCVEEWK